MVGRVLGRRGARVWAAAIAVAVIALVVLERSQGTPAGHVAVLVAARDIAIGERITPGMVTTVSEPADAVLGPDPVLAAAEPGALGRSATLAIPRGRPLAWSWLSGASGAGPSLPRGMALYALPATAADEPSVGLRSGTYVQIVVAVPADPTPQRPAHAETVEAHALVASLSTLGDGRLITVVVPRTDLATLAWLKLRGATFSYGVVGAADTRGGIERRPVTPRVYQEGHHVGAQ